jgi:hypothetical protein
LAQPSSTYRATRIDLIPDGITTKYTRGTGTHTIANKLVVSNVPVQADSVLEFSNVDVTYQALLYELRDINTGNVSDVSPNWFGVAIPNPDNFDLSSDVYVLLYFHPTPSQAGAGYSNSDYLAKNGAHGTNWKQLYAYVDRLGGQAAGAIQSNAPANRVVIFPFLKQPTSQPPYSLPINEWFNVIHDILQDINTSVVKGICTRPKKIIVATLSNGSVYLNRFLTDAAGTPYNATICEVWDFDSEITTPPNPVAPHGKFLRAYWQAPHQNSPNAVYIHLPKNSWVNFPKFPQDQAQLNEIPPLPPLASNSNSNPDTSDGTRIHHYIRDTMFLDAVLNIEADII